MRMNLDHVASGRFVLERDVHCEFDYWLLAVSIPPTKVCPQCKAAVAVKRKTDVAFSLVVVLPLVRSLFLYGGLSRTFFHKFVNGSNGALRFTPCLAKVIGDW